MPPFTHVVLTRFNLRRSFMGGEPPDEAWLEDRFRLFETFCLPSVRAQSERSFRWLVFFDAGTPDRFRERAEAWARRGDFAARFVESGGEPELAAVREQLQPGCEWLLTTRLDNDDAWHRGFAAAVHGAFRARRELLNLPHGYVLDAPRRRLYRSRQLSNPFLSAVEPVAGFRTVLLEGGHQAVADRVRQLETPPLWLQVVHGRNFANRVTAHMERVPLASLGEDFQLEGFPSGDDESGLLLRLENGARGVVSTLRRALRGAAAAREPGRNPSD